MGADVIKVERPDGDSARASPPHQNNISLYFASVNRNKRSIVLDLKTDAGKKVLHKLLATADVFVENMRPGVRDRLGCSDAELERINPNLVKASISGFGQTGALSGRPAYDIVVQAMSGMMSINGPPGGPATRVGFSIGDIAAAMFATIGILERLYQRDVNGHPPDNHLDVSMLACQWACMENAFARYLNAGIIPGPIGSRHPTMTPFETYPTADGDIVIGLGSAKDWPHFCVVIGLSHLAADLRFQSDEARLENRDRLHQILSEHLATRPSREWIERMVDNGIPCSAVENVHSIATNSIMDECQPFSEVVTEDGTSMRFVRNPLSGSEQAETAAPELGQHTEEILRELGLGPVQ
jgi:crotonobetainyl-CoA:carnitine CoA-transferase CaiB-like acyl-CoA transferase